MTSWRLYGDAARASPGTDALRPYSVDWSRAERLTVLGLCCAAVIVGVTVLLLTIDIPGDGPTHAIQAYEWSRHPRFAWGGIWLPGFAYLAGIGSLLIPNPLIEPRIFNLALSTLAIPVFYALVRRLYGPPAATLGTAMLVFLPLHVGLSVSSLTEPSFLFFMFAALLCLAQAVEVRKIRPRPFGLFLLFFSLAELTRYEAWSLIPLVLVYLYWRSRAVAATAIAGATLLAFPTFWSAESYRDFGNPFFGLIQTSIKPLEGAAAVSSATAIANIALLARSHLGWLLLIGAIAGLASEISRSLRGQISAERTAYAGLVSVLWALIFVTARARGPALNDRNLLLGFVVALPVATLPYLRVCERYRHGILLGVLAGVGSMAIAYVANRPGVFVTSRKPTEIVELARWLATTPYRNDAVLETKMDWDSTYLPLYAPQLSGRFLIVSVWVDDDAVRRFIRELHPSLLVTCEEDAAYRQRVEHILGHPISAQRRIHRAGHAEAYDLSDLMSRRSR